MLRQTMQWGAEQTCSKDKKKITDEENRFKDWQLGANRISCIGGMHDPTFVDTKTAVFDYTT